MRSLRKIGLAGLIAFVAMGAAIRGTVAEEAQEDAGAADYSTLVPRLVGDYAVPAARAVLDALHEVDVDQEVERAAEGKVEVGVLEAARRYLGGAGVGWGWGGPIRPFKGPIGSQYVIFVYFPQKTVKSKT